MSSGESAPDRRHNSSRAGALRTAFPSNSAPRSNDPAVRGASRGGHGRGRGNDRGRGRGAASVNGGDRSLSWRAARTDSGASTPALDYGAVKDFSGDPREFGTPAFVGGGTSSTDSDPFGGAFDEPVIEPAPSKKISTLEVLGEDSESRRKRFESTLSHNRYLEVRFSLLVVRSEADQVTGIVC